MIRMIAVAMITTLISSCSSLNTVDNNHAGVCKELKRRIVFNAATPNNTEATQQRAELQRLNKNYNAQGC